MFRALALLLLLLATPSMAAEPGSWDFFKEQFISEKGRIIDYGQNGISHSEGQGYGMLLAVAHRDAAAFDHIWQWTMQHLQVRRSDALSSWSWGKRPTGELAPIDFNNATDGDICIAYALILAHQRWNRPDYLNAAIRIITSIHRFLILERYGYTVILPGYYGFVTDEALLLNPSYSVLPAFRTFARFHDRLHWERVYRDMLRICKDSGSGSLQLPPDWVRLSASSVMPDPEKPGQFGYEAIRIVLYLCWDGSLEELPFVSLLLDRIEKLNYVPEMVDLKQDKVAKNEGSAGFIAVMARAAAGLHRKELAEKLWERARGKIVQEKKDYYSHVLFLFAGMRVTQ